ncbi:MAG: hypothetical protein DU429_02480 [Candidatus Tokpelaia sp.]|nr:MAG: hypothetical protein DU430_05230 [Candidatus Tokpelaia sp.]KAA6207349.1 MAG: hypothetical protein DU429_02480 [Candidatus Tokpelaia sp.]KAA6405138.1 hypothetical protein DPQ22_06195 [Candidatus Tokpelaia sp.]
MPGQSESPPYLTGKGVSSAEHSKSPFRTADGKGAKKCRIFPDSAGGTADKAILFVRRIFAWQIAALLPVIACISALLLLPKAAIGRENMGQAADWHKSGWQQKHDL